MFPVAEKKAEPIRRDSEQDQILDTAQARIQEMRLRTKGNPKCAKGCGGRGYFGTRTVALKNGKWDAYLELCECSKKSEYAELSDKVIQLAERVNQLANLVYTGNEVLFRHTFWGGLKVTWKRAAAFLKRIVNKLKRKTSNEQPAESPVGSSGSQ
jgi:hypothetical protein